MKGKKRIGGKERRKEVGEGKKDASEEGKNEEERQG